VAGATIKVEAKETGEITKAVEIGVGRVVVRIYSKRDSQFKNVIIDLNI
jgi:hypothetical protein